MGRLALWILVAGACTPTAGELAIDRVEPSSGNNLAPVPIRVEGSNFLLPIRSDVDDGRNVVGAMAVSLGDVPLLDAVRRDHQLIEGSVPAGLAPGDYDVIVNLGDRSDVLVAGYRVINGRVRPPAGACGRPGALADDFADGVPAPTWRVDNPGNVVEAGGTLEITPRAGSTGTSGYRADPYVDLTDAAAEVEVRTMVVAGTGASASFQLSNGGASLGFIASDGQLSMGTSTQRASIAYDPVAHRIWRVEHAGGMVSFATSPDGTTWTTRHAVPAPAWIRVASLSLGASNPGNAAAPGTVTFAELSTYVAPSTWCAANTLSDGFDDAMIGIDWAYHAHTSNGCAETESGTAAHVDQNGTQACDAYFAASTLYTLESSAMVARITAITTYTAGWITYLGAYDLEGRFVRMYFEQNMMCADGTGLAKTCVAYNTTEDLWRIRGAGGMIHFEVAHSASTVWRPVLSASAPFPMTAIRPRFGTATDRAIGQGIGLSVDAFN